MLACAVEDAFSFNHYIFHSRYILVSKPKTEEGLPLPTRLEKYLIAVRFPEEGRRLFKRIRKLIQPESLHQTDLCNIVASSKVS